MMYLAEVVANTSSFISAAPILATAPIVGALFGMAVASFARDIGYQTWR